MTSKTVDEIYEFFKNQRNEVDVEVLKKFIDNDTTIKSNCNIFVEKVKAIKDRKSFNKKDFQEFFNQSLKDQQHFQAVFGAFDTDKSGQINKKELSKLLEKYDISVKAEDLDIMIQMCSENGDFVNAGSLFKFLSS